MKNKKWPDEKIIRYIRKGGKEEDEALRHLYEESDLFSLVLKIGKTFNGSREDAKDVFQVAMIALYQNIVVEKFKGNSSLKTYFHRIAKNKWIDWMKKQSRTLEWSMEFLKESVLGKEFWMISEERRRALDEAIELLSGNCPTALRLWAQGYAMEAIAVALYLKNANGAKKAVDRCRQRLRDLLDGNSGLLDKILGI